MRPYTEIISINPKVRSGKPCIRDLRITISDILKYLSSGMTIAEIIADFPGITEEDIHDCLAFAADSEKYVTFIIS